jgi:predicted component of type VI protein secretion system
MKVQLVVASGVRQGTVIPIGGAQFLIGRDEACQLRPASPAISKKHCGIYVRDGQVFVADLGSTNGTFLNDRQLTAETAVASGDRLRVGPLDFTVNIVSVGPSDSTPLPEALKAVGKPPAATPAPQPKVPAAGGAPAQPMKPAVPIKAPVAGPPGEDHDHIAAMLLGMGEDEPSASDVPGGSTVMEMPAVELAKAAEAKKDEKKIPSKVESSTAAADLLRKYMRRPK